MTINLPDRNWSLLKKGEHQAFKELYYQHYPMLYRYALRIIRDPVLADQSIQDLFVCIWETRAHLADVTSPKAYLLTSLRRRLLAAKPESNIVPLISSKPVSAFEYSALDIRIEQEDAQLRHDLLTEALNQLPVRQREAIYLKFYEELSYDEVAKVMGVKYQSAVNFVYRGLVSLKEDTHLQKLSPFRIVHAKYLLPLAGLLTLIY
ncbi:MAG: RNA polymerase sigma factor [Cyclobacteriaceae bacterium]